MNLKMTSELAEICGVHAGDGYMRLRGNKGEFEISGGLDEKEYYDNHLKSLFEKTFNIKVKPKLMKSNRTYGFSTSKKIVFETLCELGFPYGKKTLTVSVPKPILESRNLDIIYPFIRGLFDTDGCMNFRKKEGTGYTKNDKKYHSYPRISLSSVSRELIKGVQHLFEKTGFNFKLNKYKSKLVNENNKYTLTTQGYSSLYLWMNNIGFANTSKYSRYLIWKEYGFCPANTTHEQRKGILNKDIDPYSFYKTL